MDSEKELLHLTSLTPNLVHNIRLDQMEVGSSTHLVIEHV